MRAAELAWPEVAGLLCSVNTIQSSPNCDARMACWENVYFASWL